MKRKKLIVYSVVVLILSIIVYMTYKEMTYYGVRRIEIVTDQRTFEKTPASFDEITILFFSDIHYNLFMDKERLEPFIETIIDLDPDIVLFGGDLYDHPSVRLPSQQVIDQLSDLLARIPARLGKYAVLGNHDHESTRTRAIVSETLQKGGFMVLVNEETHIYNQQKDKISLIGLDSQLLGSPDIEKAFSMHDDSLMTIVLSHTPDIIDLLPINKVDWQLSGHSHGGQIALPLIGPIMKVPYAQNHIAHTSIVNGIRLDISNGIGTTRYDMRLFANPQIHLYTLRYDD